MAEDSFVVRGGVFTKAIGTVTAVGTATGRQGEIVWVNDLTENRNTDLGKTATGGGTFRGRILSDGTSWRVHGSND